MKRVCIIVLNWNGWRDTVACLASLRQLDCSDCTVVVVDNGSTDESVHHIRQAFPDLELLESGANLGFGGGCNVGIRHALDQGAEYVWLINSDATVAPDALSALVAVADGDARLGSVGSVLYEADDPTRVQLWGGGRVNLWLGRSVHCLTAGTPDFISGASMLLRARALREVGLFDQASFFMYWEDTDLGFRLRRAGWTLAVAAASRVWHRQSASLGMGSPLLDEYAARSCFRFLRRHSPLPTLSVTLALLRYVAKRAWLGRADRLLAIWKAYRTA